VLNFECIGASVNFRFIESAGKLVKVTGFIAREPADGAEPTQNTDVYLAYDQHNLYAVFVCWDTEPSKIRARMTRREDVFSFAQSLIRFLKI
jgi:hypothetical protein